MLTLIMTVGLLYSGRGLHPLRDNEMIIGGGSCETDGMWVSGPSLCLRRHTPGVVVGMVRPARQERRYAYVLVIKGDPGRTVLAEYDSRSSSSGARAHSGGFVAIRNRKVVFAFDIEDGRLGKGGRESVSINGKAIDLRKGRVVLVDLSAGVRWRQLHIDLPASPSWPTGTAEVEANAKELLDLVRRATDGPLRQPACSDLQPTSPR